MDVPFFARASRHDTWEVADRIHTVLDQIPTETSAWNVAEAMNNAYKRGYAAAQEDIRAALGIVR
jgi:hypothetical protein